MIGSNSGNNLRKKADVKLLFINELLSAVNGIQRSAFLRIKRRSILKPSALYKRTSVVHSCETRNHFPLKQKNLAFRPSYLKLFLKRDAISAFLKCENPRTKTIGELREDEAKYRPSI